MDLNNRKAETKEERQKNEMRIQEINHRLSISMGEVKTLMESMKLTLLTKWASGKFGQSQYYELNIEHILKLMYIRYCIGYHRIGSGRLKVDLNTNKYILIIIIIIVLN